MTETGEIVDLRIEDQVFTIIEQFAAVERDGGLSDAGFAAVLVARLRPLLAADDASDWCGEWGCDCREREGVR